MVDLFLLLRTASIVDFEWSPSFVTRKKTARKNGRVKSWRGNARDTYFSPGGSMT